MGVSPRPPSADEHLEASRANAVLARMDLCEDLARICEREIVPGLRERYAARYRRVIDVDPSAREALRSALEQVAAGGGGTVREAMEDVQRRAKGSSVGGSTAGG